MLNQKELISQEVGQEAFDFINRHVDFFNRQTLVLATTAKFNIDKQPINTYKYIVNLKRINDIRRINKFLESVNSRLPNGGIFIDCVETFNLRKRRILKKYPPVLNYIYYILDWIFKRIFPKLILTKRFYFFLTRGQNRVLSKAETLGRLYSCGFEIVNEAYIDGHFFFSVKKIKKPTFDNHPTYGPLVNLKRVGKNGKKIKVFKLRTMHPYSEYIQKYVYDLNGSKNGDKANNDFRVTTLGAILRKFWLDEIPMIWNLFKGDLKLVGFRPLSDIKLAMYPKEAQEHRKKYKPGLIPPFYVDLPNSFEDLVQSEIKYLQSFEKHPFLTDLKYFFRAFHNILFKKVRSK